MDKIWEVAPRKFEDIVDQLLYNRGVIESDKDDEQKLRYFQPDFDQDVHDPFLMTGVKEAVERIEIAKEKGEKVGVFGDYDADGIPGAALLYRALTAIGFKVEAYIPNRENGYGLSKEGLNFLKEKGCTLIITVDLGIRSSVEAEYAKKIGIDLIITDHHLPGDDLPQAFCVINPKQQGDKYPFKDLCGCAVSYKVIQALSQSFPQEIDEKFLKWNLDLVAISTISDVVPLSGENRVLAKYGLVVMRKTKNIGLSALLKVANIAPDLVAAYHVGFQIGPRINAPGRMDHATKSFELLVTESEQEAADLALWLNEKNESRQVEMEKVQNQAIETIESDNLALNKIIVVAGKWPKGVIGPSASKIAERYGRPAILFAEGTDYFTGSARGVSGVNLVELFEKAKETIYKFGGHKGAAGISVAKSKFAKFKKLIEDIAAKEISDQDLIKKIKIDALLKLDEITKTLYEKILAFEPFGMENSKPVFEVTGTNLSFAKFVGAKENHFSALVGDNPHRLKIICFNFPYEKSMIEKDSKYDLVFSISLDEWQGKQNLSLNIIDLRIHTKDELNENYEK